MYTKLKEYQVNYVEKKIQNSNASFWKEANVLTDFCSPWEDVEISKIEFRALWDSNNFYFQFTVFDSDIYIDKTDDSIASIGNSDRVELFFRTDQNLNPYYCLEMDTEARVMDFRAYPGRNFEFDWEWSKKDLQIIASKNEKVFTVEGEISIKSLEKLGLIRKNKIEVGVFRAKFSEKENQKYEPTWITWVDPKTVVPDFHIASSFGVFVLKK